MVRQRIRILPIYRLINAIRVRCTQVHTSKKIYPRRNAGINALIVSALYGILNPEDFIRDYELKMTDSIPGIGKVSTWWRHMGLRQILVELIQNLGVNECHDLLVINYRSVFLPWPSDSGQEYFVYNFPGQGIGSLHQRGLIIEDLLNSDSC